MNSCSSPRAFHSEPLPPGAGSPLEEAFLLQKIMFFCLLDLPLFALVCRSQVAVLRYYKINSYLREKNREKILNRRPLLPWNTLKANLLTEAVELLQVFIPTSSLPLGTSWTTSFYWSLLFPYTDLLLVPSWGEGERVNWSLGFVFTPISPGVDAFSGQWGLSSWLGWRGTGCQRQVNIPRLQLWATFSLSSLCTSSHASIRLTPALHGVSPPPTPTTWQYKWRLRIADLWCTAWGFWQTYTLWNDPCKLPCVCGVGDGGGGNNTECVPAQHISSARRSILNSVILPCFASPELTLHQWNVVPFHAHLPVSTPTTPLAGSSLDSTCEIMQWLFSVSGSFHWT